MIRLAGIETSGKIPNEFATKGNVAKVTATVVLVKL